jgi:acetyltransferase-like isoleucine patch superfamily enzyme
MKFLKHVFKYIYLRLHWTFKNLINDYKIYNKSISISSVIGKKTMIRNNTEVYKISLGDYSYISGPRSYIEEAIVGKYCSIARQVVIGVSDHNMNWVTTSPIVTSIEYGFVNKNVNEPQKPPPIIGNDVWIGMNCIIMRGVTIGDGAILAAGSIVTKNVEPYSVVGGIPAKLIKYRFTKEQISKLLQIQWWNWDEQKIKENINCFYDIGKFIELHGK